MSSRTYIISSSCCVRTNDGYTDFFNIETGVKQGCILSPVLFLLAVDYVMKKVMMSPVTGIPWTNGSHLTDLDFADDIALLVNTKPALQSMTTCLEGEDKTKVMRVNHQTKVQITIGQQTVEDIDKFTYLGSVVSNNDGGSEADVRCRIGKAAGVFQHLRRIWSSTTINTGIKMHLYSTIVIPTAIYASETWRNTKRIAQKLNFSINSASAKYWVSRIRTELPMRKFFNGVDCGSWKKSSPNAECASLVISYVFQTNASQRQLYTGY
ncbi:hypothetical protein P4O66_001223 [Electrophorus voltai]|uniref:Reverse transcriptase domain-containing protein n=1 Tax=Electrophorus voltai TaxID=2609070 RepID=A0AAD8ZDH9_9TELE|nr:hypothetical protein P4O66_001223 [Electrophorus voltai]